MPCDKTSWCYFCLLVFPMNKCMRNRSSDIQESKYTKRSFKSHKFDEKTMKSTKHFIWNLRLSNNKIISFGWVSSFWYIFCMHRHAYASTQLRKRIKGDDIVEYTRSYLVMKLGTLGSIASLLENIIYQWKCDSSITFIIVMQTYCEYILP